MIGPRPTRGKGGARPGLHASSRQPPVASVASKEKSHRSRSRSGKNSVSRSASSESGSSDRGLPQVPLNKVETLGQMARHASALEKMLKRGEVKARELVEVSEALARSKFFDAGLIEPLHSELGRACRKGHLNSSEILSAICALAELNAYEKKCFQEACSELSREVDRLSASDKKRLEASLKRVGHDPGESFLNALNKTKRASIDGREPCPLFFRGQCKWGPKCKLSHDDAAFERAVNNGSWKPPTESGGKSVGYKQSADLFKADRCGALW